MLNENLKFIVSRYFESNNKSVLFKLNSDNLGDFIFFQFMVGVEVIP